MGLGPGTNNYAELTAVRLLILFSSEKYCKTIHFFGDSMNVVNWVNKVQRCQNVFILTILEEIIIILEDFDAYSCHHVYRERTVDANQCSKKGLSIGHG